MSTPEDLLGLKREDIAEFEKSNEVVAWNRTGNLEAMTDPSKLALWMKATARMPLEAVDDKIVNQSYPAIAWLFRQAAVLGDLKAAKAAEMWLTWAHPIANRPPKPAETKPSRGSIAFLARPVQEDTG